MQLRRKDDRGGDFRGYGIEKEILPHLPAPQGEVGRMDGRERETKSDSIDLPISHRRIDASMMSLPRWDGGGRWEGGEEGEGTQIN